MNATTQQLVAALLGLEREHTPDSPDYPVDNPMEWTGFPSHARLRWASLLALENGDIAEAGVLSQLSISAGVDSLNLELYQARNGYTDKP